MEHTPGPWAIETDHDEDIQDTVLIHGAADAPGLVPIALVYTADAFPCADDDERESFRNEYTANAHLIAAAPDLLAQLEALAEAASNGEWHSPADCKAEKRTQNCGLCQAISSARFTILRADGDTAGDTATYSGVVPDVTTEHI